ncbi:MAG: AAA family ATPase [Aestuariivita sp.]|nr:AAA family ATPase [Aestuariivita sp.]MCY4201592.1 AAA family ATPase [Aestuariivita sp.]MCY4287987.1 AAA family ATPase [Aestuariivita sp.]MCY4347580.1 AAA family ATPase [Aestuariivita sp.]
MLTKLRINNFKRFDAVEIELGNPVVFVGPNNSGKTSAMQALSLWNIGVKRWEEKRAGKSAPEKRPGVTINRRDLVAMPVPVANLLWHDLQVRNVTRANGSQRTENVWIDILVEGIKNDQKWQCGLEFYYANEESFYCRPLRLADHKHPERMPVPVAATSINIALLPPMSGLAASETRLDHGAVNVRIGEGRTAEILRNLCHQVYSTNSDLWENLVEDIRSLFGITLAVPRYIAERGEISMQYQEREIDLDLSSSGRGLQQTVLMLAYIAANPGATILLDEPDAHLEILRQRQIYKVITELAKRQGTQVIAASHSEVLLNEAAGKDLVVAFIGTPHRIEGRSSSSQVHKSLSEIGFDHYHLAEIMGWVLYLEGSTDLAILQAFADRLNHNSAIAALQRPFVHYVGNQPKKAEEHFFGLREAFPNLRGVGIFDRLEYGVPENKILRHLVWHNREIENYLCTPQTLAAFAHKSGQNESSGPLFDKHHAEKRVVAMQEAVTEVTNAMATLDKRSPWDPNTKVSDDFLTPLFKSYYNKLNLPNLMEKRNFYELATFVPEDEISLEIREKLDAISEVAECQN